MREIRRDDQNWDEILRMLEVPGYPRTYVLGSLAKHVTFYSQQVRALNLIHALCCTGRVDAGSQVAIIGGGLAGLTAAAGALRRGLQATVFEAKGKPDKPDLMELQRASKERWVDPHIYDWPDDDAPELPLLGWDAALADEIRTRIIKQVDKEDRRLTVRQARITEDHLAWTSNGVSIKPPGGDPVDADILILAVGFGTEEVPEQRRYWTNDGLDGDQIENEAGTYLVSGSGDGGLTDLMRLCIKGFQHRKLVEGMKGSKAAKKAGRRLQEVEQEVAELEKQDREDRLVKEYLSEAAKLNFQYDPRSVKVYLASRHLGALFAGNASVLNRLIVARLWIKKAFSLIPFQIGTPVTEKGVQYQDEQSQPVENASAYAYKPKTQSGMTVVEEEAPRFFYRVIIRHGPGQVRQDGAKLRRVGPLEEYFQKIYNACAGRREVWKATHHWNDITRRSQFGNDFTEPPPPDPRFGPNGCVVVEPRPTGKDNDPPLHFAVVGTLRALDKSNSEPMSLFPEAALESPRSLARAVRMLCRAPIAVFDVSHPSQQLLTMFLLGIRAAARRGITVLTREVPREGKLDPREVPFLLRDDMPFNLKDVTVYGRTEGIERTLRMAIESGQRRLLALGSAYQDLPVYDAVRFRPADDVDVLPVGPRDQSLMLTRFHKDYRNGPGSELRMLLDRFFLAEAPKHTPELVWINQTPSPELTTAKLYAAIRRNTLCVVDWSGWKKEVKEKKSIPTIEGGSPNVFFELGVRLAVNAKPPVCVVHADELTREHWAQLETLDLLLKPIRYRGWSGGDERPFLESFKARLDSVEGDSTATDWPADAGEISADFVYRTVRDSLAAEDEWFSRAIHDDLARSASQLLETQDNPTRRVLYGDCAAFHDAARSAALERWRAVWHYLDAKFQICDRLRAGTIDSRSNEDEAWFEATYRLWELLKAPKTADERRLLKRVSWAGTKIDAIKDADPKPGGTTVKSAAEAVKRAKRARDAKDLELADQRIKAALNTLDDLWDAYEPDITARGTDVTLEQKDLIAGLAEAHGVHGGILRRLSRHEDAFHAYDRGFDFERSPARKKDNTYNMLQRLFNRLLAFPDRVARTHWKVGGLDMWTECGKAEKEIERQLQDTRRDDPWALADLVLIRLLRGLKQPDGDREAIEDAWARFTAIRPQDFVYASNVQAMGDLAKDLRMLSVRTRPVDVLLKNVKYLLEKFKKPLRSAN